MTALRWFFWGFLRLMLAARYRLHVHGRDQLRALKGPSLVLPNHPGYIDPFLLFARSLAALADAAAGLRRHFQGVDGPFARAARQRPGGARPRRGQRAGPRPRRAGRRRHRRRAEARRKLHPLAGRPRPARRRRAHRPGPRRCRHPPPRARGERRPGAHPRRLGPSWTWAQLEQRPLLVRLHVRRARLDPAPTCSSSRRAARSRSPSKRSTATGCRSRVGRSSTPGWRSGTTPTRRPAEKPTCVPYHFLFGRRTFEFPPPHGAEVESTWARSRPETRDGRC